MKVLSFEALEATALERDRTLKNYLLSAKGRDSFDESLIDGLKESSSVSLKAINTRARIEVARATIEELNSTLGTDASQNFFFVTVALKQWAVPEPEAQAFDVKPIKKWIHKRFGQGHYLGVIEPALYVNYKLPSSTYPTVSWHVHFIMWGLSAPEIQTMIDEINRKYKSFLPGRTAAHQRPLTLGRVSGRISYMHKLPLKRYRAYSEKVETVDPETGEITKQSTGRMHQRKSDMDPNEHVRLCRILGERTILDLCFSHGAGRDIKVTSISKAAHSIRRQDIAHRKRLEELFNAA